MSYKVIQGSHGPRYMKDGKFVKKVDIPADILVKLDVGMQEITPEEPKTEKVCAICGQFGKMEKFLNGKAIVLCEDHYYSNTTGKLVQLIREKELSNAKT